MTIRSLCATSAFGLLLLSLSACSSGPILAPTTTAIPQAEFETPTGQISIYAGKRDIGDSAGLDTGFGDTVDLDDHTAFGFEYSSIGASGFGFETGISYSSADDDTVAMGVPINLELSMIEFTFGGRYTYTELGRFLPYVGAGADFILYEVEGDSGGTSAAVDENDFGIYLHAGANYVLGAGFMIGVDLRTLFGTSEDELAQGSTLDYVQFAAALGWAF